MNLTRLIATRYLGVGCLWLASLGTYSATSAAATEMSATESPAALILYDAQVFTADSDHPYAEAVAVRGDRLIAVGALDDVSRIAGPGARRIDMKGHFLMPGMIDAHAHPIAGGLSLIQANFPDTYDSVAALVRFVAQQMEQKNSRVGDVLVVNGIDIGYWAHAAEIDSALSAGAFGKQPIVLLGSDGHTAWGNRLVRNRAGITRNFIRGLKPDERLFYGADAAFNPNGFVVDVGLNKLNESLPKPSSETMLEAGRAAVHYMNAFGITGWLDAAVSGSIGGVTPARVDEVGYLPVYQQLAQRGELTAHVAAYPVVQPDGGNQQIDVVEAIRKRFQGIPNLTLPGLKVFADGVVEIPSQTAALTKPYLNNGHFTNTMFTPSKMNALVTEAYRRGLTVHVHAIGDLAVKASLDAFEAARKANPSSTLPFVLTHAQFVDPQDIPRFAQLRVIAALQLFWAIADQSTNEQVKPYIDPEIYRWMYPARSLLDTGATIAGASDWPVSTANPFAAIYQAETRGGPQGVLNAAQRMPRAAMLYAYTRNAAEVLNQSNDIGSLAPGKRADLTLIDRDVLTIAAPELKDAKVLFTMFGGKIVYGQTP